MRTKLLSWILLCGVAVFFAVSAHAQQGRVAGRIVVAKVKGTVTALDKATNTRKELHDNDAITQNYVVTTAADSSVILVFSNGSTINVAQDSTLAVDEFLQDPFSSQYSMATATEEPSTSTTKLTLTRGELVGNVKHLHKDAGSSFSVNTPVGAAGIRGTTFRIVFRPDSSGKAFFTLSTAEGVVILTGTNSATQQVPVVTGKEVVVTVEVNVDTATGAVTITAPPQIQQATSIPAVTQATIAAAVQQIVQTNTTVIFTSATTNTTTTPTTPTTPVTTPTTPTATTPASQTTSGDGQ
jgi:hypothetical protein